MSTYFFYIFSILILSSIAALAGWMPNSNFYIFYPLVSLLNCVFVHYCFRNIKNFLLINSFLYYILIIIFYKTNFVVNSLGFFGNSDDSFFFSQGLKFLSSSYQYSSPFDIVIWFIQSLGANDAISVVVINWFLSTMLLGLIYKLSILINPKFKVNYLYIVSLNYFYIESTVSIFRDILGLVFLVLAVIAIIENRKFFWIHSVSAILIRPMTGVLSFIFLFFKKSKFINKTYRGKWFFLLGLFLLFIISYYYLPVGFISRGGLTGDSASFSLSDMNNKRLDFVGTGDEDITSKLINLGPLGMPLVALLNIITPLRIYDLVTNVEYKYLLDGRYNINYVYMVLNYKSILSFLHIISLCFWIIPFLNGFYKTIRINKLYLIYTFLFILFIVSFISFQPRHRLHFIIFLPLIASFNTISTKHIFFMGLFLSSTYIFVSVLMNIIV